MADTQREVLSVLLRTLLNQELIETSAYGKALERIQSTERFPMFWVSPEKEETNGRAQG